MSTTHPARSIEYARYFDRSRVAAPELGSPEAPRYRTYRHGDAPDNRTFYLVSDAIEQAVNVALATGRPLLVKGEPGSGKTALARHVARYFDWGFEAVTIRSDTSVQDLQWTFDGVQRLNDAMTNRLRQSPALAAAIAPAGANGPTDGSSTLDAYFEPGPIWKAFERRSSRLPRAAAAPAGAAPRAAQKGGPPERVVLLIDEIDKADPDVPNGLLDALGNMQFRVPELDRWIVADVLPFVVVTSNDERELPTAFLRRCVLLELDAPTPRWLETVAVNHFSRLDQKWLADLLEALLPAFEDLRTRAGEAGLRKPSTAEFLDAVEASHTMSVGPGHALWNAVLLLTLWKHPVTAGSPLPSAKLDDG